MAGMPPGQTSQQTQGGASGPAASGNTPSGNNGLPTSQQLQSYMPAQVDPNQNAGYMQYYQQLMDQSLQPGFQQQDQGLQEQLASRGISNSGAAGQLMGNLYGQQGATLAGANAPIVAQGYGYTQQDQMANQGYYNNYLSTLEGQGYNTGNEGYQAYLGSFGPNPGVESMYGQGMGGAQSAYGNAYGGAVNAQGQAMGALGQAAGMGMGFSGGGGGYNPTPLGTNPNLGYEGPP